MTAPELPGIAQKRTKIIVRELHRLLASRIRDFARARRVAVLAARMLGGTRTVHVRGYVRQALGLHMSTGAEIETALCILEFALYVRKP